MFLSNPTSPTTPSTPTTPTTPTSLIMHAIMKTVITKQNNNV